MSSTPGTVNGFLKLVIFLSGIGAGGFIPASQVQRKVEYRQWWHPV